MRLILRLLANAAALAAATLLLGGITLTHPTTLGKVVTLLVVALVFGLLNAVVKPVFTLVTVPLVLLTLGLFLVVINALMLLLTSWVSSQVDLGWSVEDFGTAVLGALVVSVVSFFLNAFVPDARSNRRRA